MWKKLFFLEFCCNLFQLHPKYNDFMNSDGVVYEFWWILSDSIVSERSHQYISETIQAILKHFILDLWKLILMSKYRIYVSIIWQIFNNLQGLAIWLIQIFTSQKSVGLNSTFLQNAILSLMKIKINKHSLGCCEGIVKFRQTLLGCIDWIKTTGLLIPSSV